MGTLNPYLFLKKVFFFIHKTKFNLFKTIYINIKMFPLNTAIKLPIYVFGNWNFVELNGEFIIDAPLKRGMISIGINIAEYVTAVNGSLRMKNKSKIIFHDHVYISQGCQIYLDDNSVLELHKGSKLGDSVKLICYRNISIGEMSEITWESQVTDSNSHFIEDITTNKINNIINSISIGNYNWIGNRTTIMPGTITPDWIIVSSNSLLNKNYIKLGLKPYSLIGGMPAALIKTNVKRIYDTRYEKYLFLSCKNNVEPVLSQNIKNNYI